MNDSNRYTKIVLGLIFAALVLLSRLFYVQIVDDKYKTDAMNNSILRETIYPPRGIIYDRHGEILVGNRTCYDIMVTPREIRNLDTTALCSILNIDKEYLVEKLDYYRKFRSRIGYQTLTFLHNVDERTYVHFSESEYWFPGFYAQMRNTRDYPLNAGGNLLGYVGEVDGDYIKKHPEYKSGDYAGMTGLEATREKDLRGEKGYCIYLRDSRNRVLTSFNDGHNDMDAVPGKNITTTIDGHLQQYGQSLMQHKRGSLIAIEPSTGEILALVTSPGIDVQDLENIGTRYQDLLANPYKPLFNRPVQASYPPGSVFKLVNGMIGFQEGVLKVNDMHPCQLGYYYTPSRKLGCHKHRSPINFTDAVMMSCNSYFCYVFKDILENPKYATTAEAFDAWREYVSSFGFGSSLGSDVPSELGGTIPQSSLYDKLYGKGRWKFSSIVSLSIGQGEIGATPLQIANLCAIMANRGYYYAPHIIKDNEQVKIDAKYKERHYTKVDSVYFEYAVEGMWKAVNAGTAAGGTAALAAIEGLDVCGKTGTAENPHGADHSVFICFAPRENPKIAVAAYIENAGFGAKWACPMASLMIEKYLNGEIGPGRKWMESYVMDADLMNVEKK
ncbi:MAG: penicillin-binding protein 2 [Bacteroidales bacterium]|nr:penicillin-binding protein 2 [Bacteroidales bacterium]